LPSDIITLKPNFLKKIRQLFQKLKWETRRQTDRQTYTESTVITYTYAFPEGRKLGGKWGEYNMYVDA
jgi:hypothetical protein